jgi:hypothetical protein
MSTNEQKSYKELLMFYEVKKGLASGMTDRIASQVKTSKAICKCYNHPIKLITSWPI